MEYLVGNSRYTYSYQKLKEEHYRFCSMSDKDFMMNILEAIHLACFISYVKELGLEATLSDKGIIHELVHLASLPDYDINLKEIREQFKQLLNLD